MTPSVLLVASSDGPQALAALLAKEFAVLVCSDTSRARRLALTGWFEAVVCTADLAEKLKLADDEGPAMVIARSGTHSADLVVRIADAVRLERRREANRARDVVDLAALRYDDFLELVRRRATRQYLLALVTAHAGSVTEAARAADVKRESLHRLLRRHDVSAEDFRDPR